MRSSKPTRTTALGAGLALLLLALAARPQDKKAGAAPAPAPAPAPASSAAPTGAATTPAAAAGQPQGAGGDAAAKPKAAAMVIEEPSGAVEPPPPAPVGDERRAIGEFVRQHIDEIQRCYEKRLDERPTLQGKLVARFDIGPSGRVIGATADGIADRELVYCVVNVVRKWEFERPISGGKLRIVYPFNFQAQPR